MSFLSKFPRPSRKAIRATALIAGAIVLLEIAGAAGWWWIWQSRLGHLELQSGRAILTVEVLDESGETPVGEPITVVKKAIVTLPDGEYRLRVSGEGLLGRTYRATVNRGETIAVNLSLDEGRLLGGDRNPSDWNGNLPPEDPIPFANESLALELVPGKADIVEYTGRTVIRRDGVTGKVVWDAANPQATYDREHDPRPWLQQIRLGRTVLSLLDSAQGLDKDGTGDVVLLGSGGVGWLALSGKDGSKLWDCRVPRPNTANPRTQSPTGSESDPATDTQPYVLGQTWIDDIDGDGARELVVTVVFYESTAEMKKRLGRPISPARDVSLSQRVVQAISGRRGVPLWRYPLDAEPAAIRRWTEPASIVRGRRAAVLGMCDGQQWVRLDPARGRPQGNRIDLGFEPVRTVQYAELDGDGEPEILALGKGPVAQQQSLTAFSCATGKPLWTTAITAAFPQRGTGRDAEWPWLVDIDGDGRSEVIVPDSVPLSPSGAYRGIKAIDGATGQTRWICPMRPENKAQDGLNRVVAAPDLDGDEVGDLIAVSWYEGRNVPPANRRKDRPEPRRAFADAISGRDGRLLWSWHADLLDNWSWYLGTPRWWGLGPDGRPMLVVPLGGQDARGPFWPNNSNYMYPPAVHILEASTGREQHLVVGLNRVSVADIDGDGINDLWGEADGQLRAYRGELPEIWRSVLNFIPPTDGDGAIGGNFKHVTIDFDGDKVGDALVSGPSWAGGAGQSESKGSRTAMARSGRDGRVLWKTVLDPRPGLFHDDPARSYSMAAFPLPAGDFDGDGVPDVIVRKRSSRSETTINREPVRPAIQVLSGRDGRFLWSAGPLRPPFESYGESRVEWYRPLTIEPNSPPDLLVHHFCPLAKGGVIPTGPWISQQGQHRLARISGRTGQAIWDVAVEDQFVTQQPGDPGWWLFPKVADVDGDGTKEAILRVSRNQRAGRPTYELRVVSLSDGAVRWSHTLGGNLPGFMIALLEIAEAQPGRPATLYVAEEMGTDNSPAPVLHALDGRDGSVRWTWSAGRFGYKQWRYGDVNEINFDGGKDDSVSVICFGRQNVSRLVILDPQGRERAHHDMPPELVSTSTFPDTCYCPLDLDGDGSLDFLVWTNTRMSGFDHDMKMRWSIPLKGFPTGILPGAPGQPCPILIDSLTAIDGSSGRALWSATSPGRLGYNLLDPGDPARRPIVLSNGRGLTACRQALAVTPKGEYAMPPGDRVPASLVIDDPRWIRPLPWVEPMRPFVAPRYAFAAIALAIVNVIVPLGILRLAAGRNAWRVRTLMVLPVVAAIPLWVFQTVERLLPAQIGAVPLSPKVAFMGGTLAGVPILVLVGFTALCLTRRQWRSLAGLAGLTIAAAAIIAALWLRIDSRSMPAIEHYGRSGWPGCIVLGAYAAGILLSIGWALTRSFRCLKRLPA